jgi:ABC-type lipoprotein release transport system permease subunit
MPWTLPENALAVFFGGGTMLFLLGLFLGCAVGFIVAALCNAARDKTPALSTAISSHEAIERAV